VLFFIIIRILPDPQCIELFTSNKKAKVPWGALVKEEDFLEGDERIPSDPSKLRYSEAVDLWTRWKKKQDDGMVGLVFKRGLLKDLRMHTGRGRKGKRVKNQWKYVDPDDHDGSEEDEGEEKDEGEEDEDEEKDEGEEKDKLDDNGNAGEEEECAGGEEGAGREEGTGGEEEGAGGEEGAGNDQNGGEGGSGNGDGDDEDEVKDLVNEPHISSPACHSQNKKTKMKFLRGLTKEPSYLKLIKTAQSVSLDFCM